MAKKNKMDIQETISMEQVDNLTLYTDIVTTPEPQIDPIRYQVLHFRGKGFDNNRIAALLGIQKSIVDGIK